MCRGVRIFLPAPRPHPALPLAVTLPETTTSLDLGILGTQIAIKKTKTISIVPSVKEVIFYISRPCCQQHSQPQGSIGAETE